MAKPVSKLVGTQSQGLNLRPYKSYIHVVTKASQCMLVGCAAAQSDNRWQ